MDNERVKIIRSFYFPVIFLILIWIVKIIEAVFNISFSGLGIVPLKAEGLIGVITAPLIHGDFAHLFANTLPLMVLSLSLFYFYRTIAMKVFILIYVLTGIWVWLMAREASHIGASGVVYGLASFLFWSGIIRRNSRLLAITLMVAFLYGSMIWGIFPEFFPERNISWESHLMGLVAGLVLAVFFRQHGPQRKMYEWELEELEEEEDENTGHNELRPHDNRNFQNSTSEEDVLVRYYYDELNK